MFLYTYVYCLELSYSDDKSCMFAAKEYVRSYTKENRRQHRRDKEIV
jgi:hypothetical protein